MNFDQLEEIGVRLYGASWQSEMARAFNIDRRTVNGWKRQGVAKWVKEELVKLIELRKNEVNGVEL